jgi:hypothetical protein
LIQIWLDLFEKNLKPNSFFGDIGYINIFSFVKEEKYYRLLFGEPGNGSRA